VPVDLVALPLLVVVLVAGLACGESASLPEARRLVALALAIGVLALPALAAPGTGIAMTGALLLGIAAACILAGQRPVRGVVESEAIAASEGGRRETTS
jgi:hypothetical protein